MSKENDIKNYREISKALRSMADYMDELAELGEEEETEEAEKKMEEVLGRYLVAAMKMQSLQEQL
jgi:soluble cytochrome b562